jgi:nucleoside-diphosphate-sugar epimerase
VRVVLLGGSGLLGHSIGRELLDRGHQVVVVSRSGTPDAGTSGEREASVVRADLTRATDDELDALLSGADAAVYGLGTESRTALPVPVAESLHRTLVSTTERCARAARRCGVRHFVVLGSYLSTFDRTHPQWRLAEHHPYVRARVDQAAAAARGGAEGSTSVLEIPYVFGAVPGLEPTLKAALFDRLRRGRLAIAFQGGTAAITNTDVARAATALLEGRVPAGRYPLAVDNITYRQLTEAVLAELDRRVRIVTPPAPVLTAGLVVHELALRARGRALAQNPRHFARDVLGRRLYLDVTQCSAPFELVPRSVDDALRSTVRAAYPRN